MKTWLVFEPARGGKNSETAERVVFLREKFSWPALFLAPLWLLWHRLWIGFLLWVAALIAVGIATQLLELPPMLSVPSLWIPSLMVAFEASELRRRKLIRSGYRDAGVVVAERTEDAEQRFFEEWVKGAASGEPPARNVPPSGPAASSRTTPMQGNPVIGLFPEPGAR